MADDSNAMEVPYTTLSHDALHGLAEAFVLREGTDYGETAYTMAEKVAHVLEQLKTGDATIVYVAETQSVDIVLTREFP